MPEGSGAGQGDTCLKGPGRGGEITEQIVHHMLGRCDKLAHQDFSLLSVWCARSRCTSKNHREMHLKKSPRDVNSSTLDSNTSKQPHLLCRIDNAADSTLHILSTARVHEHDVASRTLNLCPLMCRWLRRSWLCSHNRCQMLTLRAPDVCCTLHDEANT
jgi:hypothetical protein